MPRVEDDEMVQAVPADRADHAFDEGTVAGTPGLGCILIAKAATICWDVQAAQGAPSH